MRASIRKDGRGCRLLYDFLLVVAAAERHGIADYRDGGTILTFSAVNIVEAQFRNVTDCSSPAKTIPTAFPLSSKATAPESPAFAKPSAFTSICSSKSATKPHGMNGTFTRA